MSYNFGIIMRIGWREFYTIIFNPIILVLIAFALFHVYINAAFGYIMLDMLSEVDTVNDMFITGYAQVYAPLLYVYVIMSGFLGVLSISEERGRGSLKVLLCKPLYKNDVIIGKIVGIGGFMLSFIVLLQLLTGLMLMVYYREPYSASDYLGRLIVFIFSNFLLCLLIIAASMLIGLLLKNTLLAASTVAIYLFVDFWGVPSEYP